MPYAQRLDQLRTALHDASPSFDGFMVPRVDRYQGEYVQPTDERLAWLTGFTGSAGFSLVLPDTAALFVDGRYTLQAKQQVLSDLYQILPLKEAALSSYLQEYIKTHSKKLAKKTLRIAYDPWLHTLKELEKWHKLTEQFPLQFIPISQNPIDDLWFNKPERSLNPVVIHDLTYAGTPFLDKIQQIQKNMEENHLDAALITSPASLCWLLNIRGTDFPCTPLVDALAIVHKKKPVDLFINPAKISDAIRTHLGKAVHLHPEETLFSALNHLDGLHVAIDPNQTPLWILNALERTTWSRQSDLCSLPKALKSFHEIKGIRQAHLRDGVALTKFFSWLHTYWDDMDESPIDELMAAEKLEEFRKEGALYQGPSFETIAGFGSNGAIVHYHSSPKTSQTLDGSSLFLLDSGGQYLDGTTDVTRTLCLGEPSQEQKHHFTLVLKGHINLAMAKFPHGTTGTQLDALARFPLWQEGLDYDHGTGHGVGHYLSVHEGPQSISKSLNPIPLQPGMVLSNEPGYYREGHYGIRIENLVTVQPAEGTYERPLLCFETLTLVPLDRKLIDADMLTIAEWEWLNAYHQKVRKTLLPHLDPDTAAWLVDATEEI